MYAVAIAVDWITDKIYWANVSPQSNTISVADIHISYRTKVTNLSSFEPEDILVDAINRYNEFSLLADFLELKHLS